MADLLCLTIPSACDGISIKQFLRGELHFSMHQISRIKYRPEGIRVNGETVWVNAILRTGDVLSFALDDMDSRLPQNAATAEQTVLIPVLYEDDFLLIADKPSGMVSHPSAGHHGDSALDILRAAHGRLYLIGRLDKDTSGALLFAKQQETASLLAKQKENGLLKKVYIAEVSGVPDPPAGAVSTPIRIAREMPLLMETGTEAETATGPHAGLAASTHYETISVSPDGRRSLLRITIEHGRTHQIRVHLSSIGHPLVGDTLYGEPTAAPAGMFTHLHARNVMLRHPFTGEKLSVSAPLPDWAESF